MDILLLLIPLSVIATLGIVVLLAWNFYANQFDKLESEGERILEPTESAQSPTG